jgi:hypothetical protein
MDDPHTQRWRQLIGEFSRVADMLESGKIRSFAGSADGRETETSAADAKLLRTINAMLLELVRRRLQRIGSH